MCVGHLVRAPKIEPSFLELCVGLVVRTQSESSNYDARTKRSTHTSSVVAVGVVPIPDTRSNVPNVPKPDFDKVTPDNAQNCTLKPSQKQAGELITGRL